ncbi:MAG: efflux RND transporter permease subunit, partial [Gammaproteobacteria bacterium]
ASEGRSRSAGAQEPQCILKYMRIPSTAGTRDPERSRFFTNSEMRQVLGTAVFSGMLGVTLVGLLLTPVFYVVIRGMVRRGIHEPSQRASPGTS